jgi:hypothetical protein
MPKIPEFKSTEEESEFWDTHDATEYLVDTEEVEVVLVDNRPAVPVTIPLQPSVVAHLKIVAEREGIAYQTLLQSWIVARLEQEPCTLESPQANTP